MSRDLPEPLGFPRCYKCFYLQNGSPGVCIQCAHETIEPLSAPLCQICAQQIIEGAQCRNKLCLDPNRAFDRIEAIAKYGEPILSAITGLKRGRQKEWAIIFGRLIIGHLDKKQKPYTVIVPNPTYMETGDGHTELVLESAMTEDVQRKYNFEPRVLSMPLPKGTRGRLSYDEKLARADELRDNLVISTNLALKGADVLIYDDVCTTGLQLNAVAIRLKEAGARSVDGLVLARKTWS